MKVKSFMWLALAVCLPGLIVSCGKKQAGDASQAGAGAAGAYKTMTVERSDKEFTRTYSATRYAGGKTCRSYLRCRAH